MEHIPNGHSTLNQPRFDVDIMSIRQRSNLDKFPRHFLILFRCNFADQKVHVVSRYFFFNLILLVEKSTLSPRTFSDVILMVDENPRCLRVLFSIM